MNFLWLAHAIPYPPKAGFLLRSYNLLRELARDHTVDVIAFVQEHWVVTLFPSLEEGLEESRRELRKFCRNVTFLPIDNLKRPWGKKVTALWSLLSGSSYTTTWLISSAARAAIARQLSSATYDLVHFDTIGLAPYRHLAGATPATLTHHNIESHMMLRRAGNADNVVARKYLQHEARMLAGVEKRTASEFAAHITCSELDSIRLRQIAPDARTVVIPNGVDCDFFVSAGAATRPNSLTFVGTMDWYPNVDAMLFFLREIWPGVKEREPAATMDIAGSNPPAAVLQLARSLSGVTVHGYVPDVRPLLDSAALVVCPIRDGGGTKLKILDAFAMRKCVVAHPIACEGIDVTDDNNVILATTPAQFIAAIQALFADSGKRLAIGGNARKLVEAHYSFRAIGARFRSVMEHVAHTRSYQC
jgi:glycosyltransferase involved in cell wall biosynthesis